MEVRERGVEKGEDWPEEGVVRRAGESEGGSGSGVCQHKCTKPSKVWAAVIRPY